METPPNSAPLPPSDEAYRDEPFAIADSPTVASPRPPRYVPSCQVQVYFPPYTDAVPEGDDGDDDDDVPLAHLYAYPTEAPPAYHVVVRQSYRDTLVSHIPSDPNASGEADEEAGVERPQADDIRFGVERVVAGFMVSIVLLLVAVAMIWHVVSYEH